MRIIKDGPYGKSIYVDAGYVESSSAPGASPTQTSNHVFIGNTRVASVVKHKDETQPAMYYYATDHLGSSSVLTTSTGGYHERIEYLPYGEVWLEDSAQSSGYTTPYKFTGKELDKETGLYFFGARYYDARISRWISTDPALQEGKYFPRPNDYDTEHDFYWYLQQDGSRKLAGMGDVFNAINLDSYHYAGQNPVKLVDPDGRTIITIAIKVEITPGVGIQYFNGYAVQFSLDGSVEPVVYRMEGWGLTAGIRADAGSDVNIYFVNTVKDLQNSDFVMMTGDIGSWGFGIGLSGEGKNNLGGNLSRGVGVGGSFALPRIGNTTFIKHERFTNLLKNLFSNKNNNVTMDEIKNFVKEINK